MTSISTGEYRKSARNIDLIMPRNIDIAEKIVAEFKETYFKRMFERIIEREREESEKKELLLLQELRFLSSESKPLSSIVEEISSNNEVIHDIPALKKRIKHCKNPLERKQLEKELNLAYKEKKKNGKL